MRGARAAGLKPPALALAELVEHVASHTLGIFLGMHAGHPVAFAVARLPTSAFDLAPTISLAYSERRDRALHREIGERLRGWLLECGHDRALAVNLLHTDRAFLRGFGHFASGKKVGSVILWRI